MSMEMKIIHDACMRLSCEINTFFKKNVQELEQIGTFTVRITSYCVKITLHPSQTGHPRLYTGVSVSLPCDIWENKSKEIPPEGRVFETLLMKGDELLHNNLERCNEESLLSLLITLRDGVDLIEDDDY